MAYCRDKNDTFLMAGDEFTHGTRLYRIDKVNPKLVKVTCAEGKHYEISRDQIATHGTKTAGHTITADSLADKARKARQARIDAAPMIKPGMVVKSTHNTDLLFVVTKMQPRTARADLIRLGGYPTDDRDWEIRVPLGHLTPVDAINNAVASRG